MEHPPDRHGVVAHTDNPYGYSLAGGGATRIPRADADGISLGFAPHEPVVLSVIPDVQNSSQRFAVDPRRISQELSRQAFEQAHREYQDPEQRTIRAYQLIGEWTGGAAPSPPAVQAAVLPATNPLAPSSYVVPALAQQQLASPEAAVSSIPRPVSINPPAPPGAVAAAPPSLPGASSNGELGSLVQMMQQLMAQQALQQERQTQLLLQALAAQQQPPAAQTPLAPAPPPPLPAPAAVPPLDLSGTPYPAAPAAPPPAAAAPPPPPPREEARRFTAEQVEKALNKSLEALGIPGLGVEPQQPAYQVVFNFPHGGRHTAWYHWVSRHKQGLFLVYDTRFRFGSMYEPPALFGEEDLVTIEIPDAVGGEGRSASFQCRSGDFVHPFGCFRIINLIIADEPAARPPTALRQAEPTRQETFAGLGLEDDDPPFQG